MSLSIDLIHEMLNNIVDSIDPVLFEGLNGGVVLNEKIKYHPEAKNNDLVILGEYQRFGTIRRIMIYYESLNRQFSNFSEDELYKRLEELVYHELRHHTEYKAKVNDLVLEDKEFIRNHKIKRGD